jgi:two-component system, sensor histidine kinase and response regulator
MNQKPKELFGKKVMIVDDTPANIDLLYQTLEPEGYKISVAGTGEETLKLVPKIKPDLILLDVMLPGIDGFETCQKLKEAPETANIPIIFITAKAESEDIVKGFNLGGADYLTKPFNQEEVCARIKTHLHFQLLLQTMETQNKKLNELNDTKNKLMGMTCHDLRNPITSIRGFSKFILDKGETISKSSRSECLQNIYSASDNMLELINDLVDITAIESGKLNLNIRPDSFINLASEKTKMYVPLAENKNIKLHFKADNKIPIFKFDSNRIGQVLDNLIGNAIKFSPQNKNITISVEFKGDQVICSVKDEGPGILPEDKAKLFIPFQKLSAKPTGGEVSSGLGLGIAKKMVEAHGGKLWVESEPGNGADFRFKISIPK